MIPLGILGSARVTAGGALPGTYLGSYTSSTAGTSHTFTGVALGAASSTRTILVIAGGRASNNGVVSGITIGGNAATLDVSSAAAWYPGAIGRLVVPAGTTADVVVTFSMSRAEAAVMVYSLPVAVTVAGSGAQIATDPTVTIATAAGGWAVAGVIRADATQTFGGVTEDASTALGSYWYECGSAATTGSNLVITTTGGSSALVAAAYTPA